ncbi:MAG TPA: ORF6N domain-containing protein [Candidatus Binatia bacterium]|nr:ORF6N domain-containing protein [Candidatus Binatia bacterium]
MLLTRRHKVILDTDLAELYGVEIKALNRAFMRNQRDKKGTRLLF